VLKFIRNFVKGPSSVLLFGFFYKHRDFVVHSASVGAILASALSAFYLRFEDVSVFWSDARFWKFLALGVPIKILALLIFRIDSSSWRRFAFNDFSLILMVCLFSQTLIFASLYLFGIPHSRAVVILDGLFTFGFLVSMRIIVRTLFEFKSRASFQAKTQRLLVIGAGERAVAFTRQVATNPHLPYRIIGFLDDATTKQRSKILGFSILGPIEEVEGLCKKHKASAILIAIPSLRPDRLKQIVSLCLNARLPIKILPSLGDVVNHGFEFSQPRQARVEDLLGREPVQLEKEKTLEQLRGSVVAVTGAGGSIGSELCRQIASFSPAKLILFDQYENGLFYVDGELRKKFPSLHIQTLVGDMTDSHCVRRLFSQQAIQYVYHAAAHKHVPLMEANPHEAIRNNVRGTYVLAREAVRHGVRRFVMVSTDKAVNPKSVMGYTKRLAELVCQAFFGTGTGFVSVRFGNVLASNGSVVEIFRKQILSGGPVTVTHPDAIRYFMTIPEAVELILQAGSEGEEGQIYLLDMGEPVAIKTLAERMIQLADPSGVRNIQIQYSGLRPGEKLFEELIADGENMVPSKMKKVFVLRRKTISYPVLEEVLGFLDKIENTEISGDADGVVDGLRQLVAGIESGAKPSPELHSVNFKKRSLSNPSTQIQSSL